MELLRDILGRYLDSTGLARQVQYAELRAAWSQVLGEQARYTRLDSVRRGAVTFVVDSSALLSELRSFRQQELLAAVQGRCPGLAITDLRFKVGRV